MEGNRQTFVEEPAPKPELAHVLFADIVGYSTVSTEEQPLLQSQLWQAVRSSKEFARAKSNDQLVCLPNGDGMALVFTGRDLLSPLRTALEINAALKDKARFGLRMGLHSGPIYWVPDINGSKGAAGAGINLAQRVMDCGDAGHILMSDAYAGILREADPALNHYSDLGEVEVKHGDRVRLFNYCDGKAGNAALPDKVTKVRTAPSRSPVVNQECKGARVVLIYKRCAEPDESLLAMLARELSACGCEVFIDRHLVPGVDWARSIEGEIRGADAIIPLLSPTAVKSEMLAAEIEIANEATQMQGGKPRILPVRVNWEGPLPSPIFDLLNPIQYALWRGPEDDQNLVAQLTEALVAPLRDPARKARQLEPPGGAVALDSLYYIERPTDRELHNAIARKDSIVLVEGARQMGKTSLLARGLQRARKLGAKVACTDLQKLNVSDLATLESFYLTLGGALANQLDLDKFPEDTWRPRSGPNENFERYLRREVLGRFTGPFVWGVDEVDRLFTCPFGSEVFGLFRSWHNARALDPDSPWQRFTQVICYATEAHLFITDMNQSPFNVGTKLALRDFEGDELRELNRHYGEPLTSEAEIARFQKLIGGQPYLSRRGLHEMVAKQMTLDQLAASAPAEDGPFGDHLKRFLVLLSRDESLLQALRDTVNTQKFPEARNFHRLRAAGLLRGGTPQEAQFRCEIYETYLRKHLSP